MPVKRHPHSIRFSQEEWESISRAAARHEIAPGEFVREAAGRVAAEQDGLSDVQLTPELIELMKRTFRGVHLLAYLKRDEMAQLGQNQKFVSGARAARTAQSDVLRRTTKNGDP